MPIQHYSRVQMPQEVLIVVSADRNTVTNYGVDMTIYIHYSSDYDSTGATGLAVHD